MQVTKMIKYFEDKPKIFYILVFTFLTALIITAGFLFYSSRQADIKKQKYVELSAIAELKINQIITWRNQKFSDAQQIYRSEVLKKEIDLFFKNPSANPTIKNWLVDYQKQKDYAEIFLLDTALNSAVPGHTFSGVDKKVLSAIIKEKHPVFSDLTKSPDSEFIFADIFVPLILKKNNIDRTIGMMVFRIDPEKYLYPVIQSWPTPSKTAETLILRIENDSLVYLNNLRHKNIKPFSLKFPITNEKLPAAMAARGRRGVVEGIDYRGVPVLADLRSIPGTDWFVVTKADLDEVFAPLEDLLYWVFWVGVLLVLVTATGIGLVWRNQNAMFYKKLYNYEKENKAILKQFEYVTRYANDIIFFLDTNGNITYANDFAASLYGYPVEKLQSMNIRDLRIEAESPDLNYVLRRAEEEGGLVYQAVHRAKDGRLIYIESSSRLMEIDGRKFFQSIIRDITEKRKAENVIKMALEEKEVLLKEVHHRVKNNLQTIISLLSLQAANITDENINKIFRDSQNRIKSMALLHQQLYTQDFGSVDSQHYFEKLILDLLRSYNITISAVELEQAIESRMLSIDMATSLGLLITEIVSNILKHAFPDGRTGKVAFGFKETAPEEYELTISDNGIGLPADYDADDYNTLGMKLISNLVKQISGNLEISGINGTSYTITFSTKEEEEE